MKVLKKILAINLIALTLMTSQVVFTNLNTASVVQAASNIKISKKKKTLRVGDKYTLKITGTSKKVKWKSSNKKVATVNSKGKVKAKKKGTATITAKVGGKKYKCKITVKKASSLKAGKYTLKYGTYVGYVNYYDPYYNYNEKMTYIIKKDGTFITIDGEGRSSKTTYSFRGTRLIPGYGEDSGDPIYAIANDTLECWTCSGKYTLHYQKNS